jgi:hypothetical protein
MHIASGQVVKKSVAAGSKSARDAVMLVTDEREYVLRRQGGNPFADPVLDDLVGQRIQCEGNVHGYTFLMSQWKRTPESE